MPTPAAVAGATEWLRVRRGILGPMGVALAAKVAVVLLAWLFLQRPEWLWERMANGWDGEHYLRIARDGYQYRFQGDGDSVHWAYGYPLLIKLLGGSDVAALLVNNVASVAAVGVIAWHFGARAGLFLALFPSWIVFGTVAYSEGLFVLLGAVAIVALERHRNVTAGVAASLATLTRYMGGPMFVLAALPWDRPRDWRRLWTLGMLAVTGIAAWLFLWRWTGHFFGYYEAQKPWGGGLTTPWGHFDWLLTGWFTTQGGTIENGNLGPIDFVTRDLAFLVPAVWGLVLLWRRAGQKGTFVYSLAVVALAVCTTGTPAAALPRYLLAAFPAIAIVGTQLHSRAAWAAYTAGALAVATHGLVHFLAGYWS